MTSTKGLTAEQIAKKVETGELSSTSVNSDIEYIKYVES